MGKLDNVIAALAARNRKETPTDLTPILDDIVSGVLTRQTDQAERERRLQKSIVSLEKNLRAVINAIPQTDLQPVIAAVKSAQASIAAIKFPAIPVHPATDLTPVLQQIDRLSLRMDGFSDKIEAFHVDMPEVTVNTPQQQVAAPEPKKWVHKVIRGPNGSIREIVSTAE